MEVEDAEPDTPGLVSARHFEDALASARCSVGLAPAVRQAAAGMEAAGRGTAGMGVGDASGWSGGAGGAGGFGAFGAAGAGDGDAVQPDSGAGNSFSDAPADPADARQAAFVTAAAARAADSIRAQLAETNGGGGHQNVGMGRLAAYVAALEARLRSAGIPLPQLQTG